MHRSTRVRLALCVLAAGVATLGSAWAMGAGGEPRQPNRTPASIVAIEQDGLRYQYNPLTGRESLFDRDSPHAERRDLSLELPLDLERLRRLLSDQLGVPDLRVLHEPHREAADSLRAMGYL